MPSSIWPQHPLLLHFPPNSSTHPSPSLSIPSSILHINPLPICLPLGHIPFFPFCLFSSSLYVPSISIGNRPIFYHLLTALILGHTTTFFHSIPCLFPFNIPSSPCIFYSTNG